MTQHDIPLLMIILVAAAFAVVEIYQLHMKIRALAALIPPKEPLGGPTLNERVNTLDGQVASIKALAKEQTTAAATREEQISNHRAHLLGAREVVATLDGNPELIALMNVAHAKATIASATERLRFLGSEA